jgi:hypothetical protein
LDLRAGQTAKKGTFNRLKQNQNWERSDQPKRLRLADFRLWKEKQIPKSKFRSPKSLLAGRCAPSSDFVWHS